MHNKRLFQNPNLIIFSGLGLILFSVGNMVYQYFGDRQDSVLSSNQGAILTGPNDYLPPMQAAVTDVPVALDGTSMPDNLLSTPAPLVAGLVPDRLVIPAIGLDAPILPEHYKEIIIGNQVYIQWRTPFRRAAGWHDGSALLGEVGNTVLNGHNNEYGEVFKDLYKLKVGDLIQVYSGETVFTFQVGLSMLLPEKYSSMEQRVKNANWIEPTSDMRLTLFTCYPPDNNTFRLIVVAFPVK